jgi:hypothetical protein
MQLTGHKTSTVFERYNIVSDGDLRDAAARLDDAADQVDGRSVIGPRLASPTARSSPLDP